MALNWTDTTPVNPENLNKMAQQDDFRPSSSTFAGPSGVTITHNYGHTNYHVLVKPTEDPKGAIGDVWVSKSANTVVVYNSGSATTAFEYVIVPRS